jgi:LmbE family N-acetylglucosaminyl deacetylase
VKGQYWLGFPDAGPFDHFEVRRGIIQHIRMLHPDFILTMDPWTPYEAHTDHIRTGKAAAEASILYGMPRLVTDPEVDASYQPHEILGIAFYDSWVPNTYIDITHTRTQKHQAMDAYKAQFGPDDFPVLHMWVEIKERMHAENCTIPACTHAEGFKVLNPRLLHMVGEAWKF